MAATRSSKLIYGKNSLEKKSKLLIDSMASFVLSPASVDKLTPARPAKAEYCPILDDSESD